MADRLEELRRAETELRSHAAHNYDVPQRLLKEYGESIRWAVARIEALERREGELREVLCELAWSAGDDQRNCPACGWTHTVGHAPDCRLAAALGKGEATP